MKTNDYSEHYLDIKLAVNNFYKFCLMEDWQQAEKCLDGAEQLIKQAKEFLEMKNK